MEYGQDYRRFISPHVHLLKYAWIVIVLLVLVVLGLLSFYMVPTDSEGVVLRFGKFNRITEPGLRFKIPLVETVETPAVERIAKEEFGFRTIRAGIESEYGAPKTEESLMLCGDLSVAEVEWIVQYKIGDSKNYLFNVRNPGKLIRDVSESVMRSVVGDSSVDEVLTSRRIEINLEAEKKMREILARYDSGISIVTVKLQDVNPPEEVKSAFNEVNSSQQDKERTINEALEDYNKVIPRAQGEAKQMIEQARAYAIDLVNTAQGDASRFSQIFAEYQSSKDVTRRRMYLESMGKVLSRIKTKYIVDDEVKSLLPVMQIGEE